MSTEKPNKPPRYIVVKCDDGDTFGGVDKHSWDVFKIDDDGFESCLANTDTRAEARRIRDEYKRTHQP
tara:strand:- start:108 stop:311 length:204 start_codon:yes stop_codon:yes gene_type:complete